MGYERYSSKAALEKLNHLYSLVRLYGNFFQPVMKLKHNTRHGAKVHKVYDTARTPYQRLLESGILSPEQRHALARLYHSLDPVRLHARMDQALEQLWALAEYPDHTNPKGYILSRSEEVSVTSIVRQPITLR